MIRALLLCMVLAGVVQAAEPRLPDLKLTYAANWNGMSLGDIVVTLKPEGAAGCYRYESLSQPSGLVRMFYGKPRETSDFCLSGGKVVPKRFSFVNTRGDDNFTLEFDLAASKVHGGEPETRDIPPNAQDRFGLQQAVRLWVIAHAHKNDQETVEFSMVDDDRIKLYRFAITAYEEIEVPAGKFETVLVQRVDDPNKTSKFWLAPARDYMPIKVEQIKNGKTSLSMVLQP